MRRARASAVQTEVRQSQPRAARRLGHIHGHVEQAIVRLSSTLTRHQVDRAGHQEVVASAEQALHELAASGREVDGGLLNTQSLCGP